MRCERKTSGTKTITVVYYNSKLVHYGTMFVAPNRTQTSVRRVRILTDAFHCFLGAQPMTQPQQSASPISMQTHQFLLVSLNLSHLLKK